MKLAVITHVDHTQKGKQWYAYGPYVNEMNRWFQYVSEVRVIAPTHQRTTKPIDVAYQHQRLTVLSVPTFSLVSLWATLKAFVILPVVVLRITKAMYWADHIHVRCPGNMGLLGAILQLFFPTKPKTIKYAGNWDPNSKQPWSYKLQQWILSSRFTKNAKVLVYGEWPKQPNHIMPFFTASYTSKELEVSTALQAQLNAKHPTQEYLTCVFVGSLSQGKQPMLALQAVQHLHEQGYDIQFDMYGEGSERTAIESYIKQHQLQDFVQLHGNQSLSVVTKAYQQAHLLLFPSRSEGWPKVVAEAMCWGCVPITTRVSCTPYMLHEGTRGTLLEASLENMVLAIKTYCMNPQEYRTHQQEGMQWSRQFTIEKFEKAIQPFVLS